MKTTSFYCPHSMAALRVCVSDTPRDVAHTHAREQTTRMALAVVSGIELDRTGPRVTAKGGGLRVQHPWNIDEGDLSPTQFEYRPKW